MNSTSIGSMYRLSAMSCGMPLMLMRRTVSFSVVTMKASLFLFISLNLFLIASMSFLLK